MEDNLSDVDLGEDLFGDNPLFDSFPTHDILGPQKPEKPVERELTEEEKNEYRSSIVPQPRHCDLLKQELKKNKRSAQALNINFKSLTERKQLLQRVYRVQRRKNMIKDSYKTGGKNGSELDDQTMANSLRIGVKYLRELKVDLGMTSCSKELTNLFEIFDKAGSLKVKTLSINLACWFLLGDFEGQFSIFKRRFPSVEHLKITFMEMHGRGDIPFQDLTLNLTKRLSNLKTLQIEFEFTQYLEDKTLNIFSKTFKSRLSYLESLRLVFGGLNFGMTPEVIINLWHSFEKIPNLKRFEFVGSFGDKQMNSKVFSTLCDVLQRKPLVTLKLGFCFTEIEYNSYEKLCHTVANMLPKLQKLELDLSDQSITDDTMAYLGIYSVIDRIL